MNQLHESKRVQILSCLLEGMSVRGTGRVTGVSKGAALRLIAEVGPKCEAFHQRFVHDVPCKRLELDEMHEFIFGKSRCLTGERRDNPDLGTVWTWLAISDAKLIVSYLVGSRDLDDCKSFVGDIAYRIRGKVQITADAYGTYPAAIVKHFLASLVHFGTVDKDFINGGDPKRPEARYAPGRIRRVLKKAVIGDPDPDFMTEPLRTSEPDRSDAEPAVHALDQRALENHPLPSLGARDAGRVLQLVSCQLGGEGNPGSGVRPDRVPVHG